MHKILGGLFFLLGLLSFSQAKAQLILFPNLTPYDAPSQNVPILKDSTRISLPFFEDFSTSTSTPDPHLWEIGGGTYINNTSALEPITLNVASFDGLNEAGTPYVFDFLASNNVGLTDQLVSNRVNLAPFEPGDNVNLRFYWQRQGLTENPNPSDSLRLQFKLNDTTWVTQWSIFGDDSVAPVDTFFLVNIPVDNRSYLRDDFQFRFQSFGRQTGLFDVWHIDYVYLDTLSVNPESFFPDEIAYARQPGNLLRNYSAMPINQYLANPAEETADTVNSSVFNLSNSIFDAPAYSVIVEDTLTNTLIATLQPEQQIFLPGGDRAVLDAPIPDNLASPSDTALYLKTVFQLNSGENTNIIPPIDLRRNDTISSLTVLDDYFAYDDGTAEFAIGLNQNRGFVAVEYSLNEADTLRDVLIHLSQSRQNLAGQSFLLTIWQEIAFGEGSNQVLSQLSVPVVYPNTRDEFLSVQQLFRDLQEPEEVPFVFPEVLLNSGRFYVGWQQTSSDPLTVGFDRNNDASSKIFFNFGQVWQQFTPVESQRGSIMIRPVFGDRPQIVTSSEEDLTKPWQVYPNPAGEVLKMQGKLPLSVELYDLGGRLLWERATPRGSRQVSYSLSSLKPGFYILKGYFEKGKTASRRILIQP